jgi:hypothetical protein
MIGNATPPAELPDIAIPTDVTKIINIKNSTQYSNEID